MTDYLVPLYFRKRDDGGTRLRAAGGVLRYGPENALFTTPISELASRDVVTSRADVPILDAVRSMSIRRADTLVIVDAENRPVGMFTLADLRDRVLAPQKSLLGPIGEVASTPIV